MEFNRGGRQSQPTSPTATNNPGPGQSPASGGASTQKPAGLNNGNKSNKSSKFMNLKFASVALLFSATILVVALLIFLAVSTPKNESTFVEDDKFQAVFLNGGQVYFGQVTDLNSNYLRLVDIYYLRVNQQVQPAEGENLPIPQEGDISLVKLGCELHGPKDEMLINMDQVIFWENLKPEGQVSQAIATFKAENPDGQDCEDPGQAGIPEQQVPSFDNDEFGAPQEEDEE